MVKAKPQNINDIVSQKTDLFEEINSIRESLKAGKQPEEKIEPLSNANKISFIAKAKEAFNKYGYDIPKLNEDNFITAYETILKKPLNDANISEFIENLNKFKNIKGSKENKALLDTFVKVTADKKVTDEEFDSLENARVGADFGLGVISLEGILNKIKNVPGMQKATELLDKNIKEGHLKAEFLIGEGFGITNDLITENLQKMKDNDIQADTKSKDTKVSSTGTLKSQSLPNNTKSESVAIKIQ